MGRRRLRPALAVLLRLQSSNQVRTLGRPRQPNYRTVLLAHPRGRPIRVKVILRSPQTLTPQPRYLGRIR